MGPHKPVTEQAIDNTGWFLEEWQSNTLAGFVWKLQLVAHARRRERLVPVAHFAPAACKGKRWTWQAINISPYPC